MVQFKSDIIMQASWLNLINEYQKHETDHLAYADYCAQTNLADKGRKRNNATRQ